MSDTSKQFYTLVQQNKLSDAKKVFEAAMQSKQVDTVSALRKEVAKAFFNKQK
jgi:hypothetical protein